MIRPANHMKQCPCPECIRRRDERTMRWVIFATLVVGALLLALGVVGCSSTITPAPVESSQASYDEGEPNSGILALVDGGALITRRARDRYNALIAEYGGEFLPALQPDHGVRAATAAELAPISDPRSPISEPRRAWFLSNEGLQKFVVLNAWRRMGRAAGKTK